VLHIVVAAFNKPAAFLGRVGESGEYALGGGGVIALDDERAVDYGLLFHGFPSFNQELVKYQLKYLSIEDECQVNT
jgi:hypothetical protein